MNVRHWKIVLSFALAFALVALPGDAPPGVGVWTGLRVSRGRHFNPFPSARYFEGAARRMASGVPRARPSLVWIVGLYWQREGLVGLSFPRPAHGSEGAASVRRDFPHIHFHSSDLNAAYLQRFDRAGVDVWLQVEPGDADVETLIDLVLERYGHHRCVVGFGVDVEWHRRGEGGRHGAPVTDEEARRWVARVKAHHPRFRLFLKHYMQNRMPETERGDIVFINDGQRFRDFAHQRRQFGSWARRFAPAEVGYQFGYASDRPWWSELQNPPATLTETLRADSPNARWFYWVDFTALELFPRERE